ncbi:CinA family protein [Lachnospira multipara]|jgi:PncC family amidohydrolase|uniref:Nicotinamide-nucleotide amidase/nicotinamide-nucleotide amidase n=1 Tax=Lachnospira multipara TaxID=28051 RepID=A0A1H5RQ96_9FIRM|nr:CinA family protein [Lachnospira multipara]SEF40294.1 nicotinamide-nucleotide amidase/nicotinamide-nucleotide amidase [Lachnospira multipara]
MPNESFIKGLDAAAVRILKDKGLVLTTAESCTGGMVSSLIVNISGASNVFKEGFVTYCDEAKEELLGVSHETMLKYKAVSAEVASEMAKGACKKAKADVAVSITGVAGPSMEDGKPVGLVYIACHYKDETIVKEFNFTGDRKSVREQAAFNALKLVIDTVK